MYYYNTRSTQQLVAKLEEITNRRWIQTSDYVQTIMSLLSCNSLYKKTMKQKRWNHPLPFMHKISNHQLPEKKHETPSTSTATSHMVKVQTKLGQNAMPRSMLSIQTDTKLQTANGKKRKTVTSNGIAYTQKHYILVYCNERLPRIL